LITTGMRAPLLLDLYLKVSGPTSSLLRAMSSLIRSDIAALSSADISRSCRSEETSDGGFNALSLIDSAFLNSPLKTPILGSLAC